MRCRVPASPDRAAEGPGDLPVPDQHVTWAGRRLVVRWRPPPFDPPPDAITQAYGVCFTAGGLIDRDARIGGQLNSLLVTNQVKDGEAAAARVGA